MTLLHTSSRLRSLRKIYSLVSSHRSGKFLPLVLVLSAFAPQLPACATAAELLPAATSNTAAPPSNPILPGDHPDPTIIRVGHTYWTTSTSGDWAPEFPLFRSDDLHHWTAAGAIFPQAPKWAAGSFWAPELVYDHARIVVYYVGRKRNGPLCVAAATAPRPEGPYTDRGPLLCQSDGSIDPSMARDEHGRPFLIWKEDGNSIHQPTPIWAQPLTDDLLHVTGIKTQILVNDPSTWESGVVEAPYILRHAGRFYLFYAGNACCGLACRYAEGVARADHLLGPWIKDPSNPIIRPNAAWKCPGHGTAGENPSGKDYFIYHAYPALGTVYLGRESVLDPITWTKDGWPVINNGQGPSGGSTVQQQRIPRPFIDDFRETQLNVAWQWPVGHRPQWLLRNATLTIAASADAPKFLAHSLLGPSYMATVGIEEDGGLGIIGGEHSLLTLSRRGGHLELWRLMGTQRQSLWHADNIPATPILWLRATSSGLSQASFSYSLNRKNWIQAGPTLSVKDLLPWDQGLRIGLVAEGPSGTDARFTRFTLADLNRQN